MRRWTPLRLVTGLIVMAWGDGCSCLCDRFAAARAMWPEGGVGRTYQGFVKAWRRFTVALAIASASALRSRAMASEAWASHGMRFGFVVLAADGSRFELPRTADHERAYGPRGKSGAGPQLWVTTLWHMGLGVPWDWRIGAAPGDERGDLRSMLDDAPAGALLVMDAGFNGFDLLRAIVESGRHVLLRVGAQVELLRELGCDPERADAQTVHLWPAHAQRRGAPPLTLRLIAVRSTGDRRRKMWLATSVLDPRRLSDEQVATLYRMRWGVELCYRALKQTLDRRKLRAHAADLAALEMHGLMLGLTLLGLMAAAAVAARGHDPLSWSVAGALRAVRLAMRDPDTDWPARLAHAVKDAYTRRRRPRQRWPRKKSADPPPGRPRIRRAKRHEIKLALQLIPQ